MSEQPESIARASELRPGWTVQPEAPEPDSHVDAAPAADDDVTGDATSQFGSVALMVLGVLGGVYLLYSWAWFVIADAYAGVNDATAGASGSIGAVLQQIVFWVAPVAPAAWFLSAYTLTRGRGSARLIIALGIGAVVLLPLPILIGG